MGCMALSAEMNFYVAEDLSLGVRHDDVRMGNLSLSDKGQEAGFYVPQSTTEGKIRSDFMPLALYFLFCRCRFMS